MKVQMQDQLLRLLRPLLPELKPIFRTLHAELRDDEELLMLCAQQLAGAAFLAAKPPPPKPPGPHYTEIRQISQRMRSFFVAGEEPYAIANEADRCGLRQLLPGLRFARYHRETCTLKAWGLDYLNTVPAGLDYEVEPCPATLLLLDRAAAALQGSDTISISRSDLLRLFPMEQKKRRCATPWFGLQRCTDDPAASTVRTFVGRLDAVGCAAAPTEDWWSFFYATKGRELTFASLPLRDVRFPGKTGVLAATDGMLLAARFID